MNITIFISSISGGGAERVACNLATHLSQAGHRVTMLTMSETENTYGLPPQIAVHPLITAGERGQTVTRNIRRYRRLRRYVREADCDRYIVMLPVTTLLLLSLRRLIKVPLIAAERCNPSSYTGLKRFLLKKLAKRADGWVFQTEDAMKWYDGRIRKGVVIPNAINPAFLRDPYRGEREKTVVAAGRLADQKNFSLLIEAFADVAERYPAHRLIIYGKGPQEAMLKEKAAALGLGDRVSFPGYVDDMPEQLEKAGLFVLSSDFEGMPNALMEAMALGLPCVSTDCPCGGPAFLVRSGENGLLVSVGDRAAMADAIDALLADPAKAQAMGQTARSVAETLNPTEIYGRWEAFVRDLSAK